MKKQNQTKNLTRTRAQESSNAIERLYLTMRHLFNRGFYKPMGVSGETLRQALLQLRPEIYGSIAGEKTELEGLIYVVDRLPIGIEECVLINLTSAEGFGGSHFEVIVPSKRRRDCYRIDFEQMNIEITRGRSEIYDILTHLTFMFIESHKIAKRVLIDDKGSTTRDWMKLEAAVLSKKKLSQKDRELAITHAGNILGRTFEEVLEVYDQFSTLKRPDHFLHLIYWLGKRAISEIIDNSKRAINFSPVLRERLGHHIHGEVWANNIKQTLKNHKLLGRPIHIISANLHSVMNTLHAPKALRSLCAKQDIFKVYELLSREENGSLRNKIEQTALQEGMISIKDTSGTNIDVQIFDTSKIDFSNAVITNKPTTREDVLIVMDYAFGEQAYETIDELLKPFNSKTDKTHLNVESISVMGKAGILEGAKGDIMIPSAHIFEGTADNYPFKNELRVEDFEAKGLKVFEGAMVTVLGTSLQNRDLLKFFHDSTWDVIGLEMEGVHYQKAIQAASKIRHSINPGVKVRYAYYASDNPLETGATLASGGLGSSGVKPTYLITEQILKQILN
tara:strand:+ start:1587 stop:3275 length:1689 start_codon:yes stop_codon:yes gene_type:complete